MTDVDASIYDKLQQPNQLQNLSNMLGVVNSANQNKLFQQEFNARQGLGQAAQGAIDPSGNFDPQAYAQQLAKNKDTAYLAAQGLDQGLKIQQSQNAAKLQQYDIARKRIDLESQGLMTLLNNPGVKKSDIHSALADTVVNSMDEQGKPLITPSQIMDYIGSQRDQKGNVISPGLADLPDEPGVLNNYLKQKVARNQAMAGHVDEARKILYSQNLALAPETEVVGQGADGRPAYVSNTMNAPSPTVGMDQAAPGAAGPGAQPDVAQGPPTPMKNSPLAGVVRPRAPQGSGASAGNQSGNVVLSMPPGQEAMMEQGGGAAIKRATDVINAAATTPISQDINKQVIQLAGQLGQHLGPTATGVTESLGKLASVPGLDKVPGLGDALKGDRDNAGKLMELKKFLLRTAQIRSQSLGLGTDFQQGMNVDANPNDKQFPEIIQRLAKYNLALDYIDQGKANAMQAFPGATTNPAANEKFEKEFRNAMNVDVYRALLATPNERKEIYKDMSDAKKTELKKDLRNLNQLGAIPQALLQPAQ